MSGGCGGGPQAEPVSPPPRPRLRAGVQQRGPRGAAWEARAPSFRGASRRPRRPKVPGVRPLRTRVRDDEPDRTLKVRVLVPTPPHFSLSVPVAGGKKRIATWERGLGGEGTPSGSGFSWTVPEQSGPSLRGPPLPKSRHSEVSFASVSKLRPPAAPESSV